MRNRLLGLTALWIVLAVYVIYRVAEEHNALPVAIVAWCGGIASLLILQAAWPTLRPALPALRR